MNNSQIKALANIVYQKIIDIKKQQEEKETEQYYQEFLVDFKKELDILKQLFSHPNISCVTYIFFGYKVFNIEKDCSISKRSEELIFKNWLTNVKKVNINTDKISLDNIYNRLVIENIDRDKSVNIDTWVDQLIAKFI